MRRDFLKRGGQLLKGMASAGYLDYAPEKQTFSLPEEHAYFLASEGSDHFVGGLFAMVPPLMRVAPQVAEAFRKHGLGRELVERCAAALKAEGIEKINLWVKADNATGLAFWNRVGGRERHDVVTVSIITGDNPNA